MSDVLSPGDDFAAVASDEALVDALAAGWATGDLHPVESLLGIWRDELDGVATSEIHTTTALLATPVDARDDRRWYRTRRGAAGAAAVAVLFAASTGVAAALPGSPVHRALFGSSSTADNTGATVRGILDEVAAGIDKADAAGGITAERRTALEDRLEAAQQLLQQHDVDDPVLSERLSDLFAALASVPSLDEDTTPDATLPDDNGGSGGVSDRDEVAASADTDEETDGDDTRTANRAADTENDEVDDGDDDGTDSERETTDDAEGQDDSPDETSEDSDESDATTSDDDADTGVSDDEASDAAEGPTDAIDSEDYPAED
jgi:hypothetical protein